MTGSSSHPDAHNPPNSYDDAEPFAHAQKILIPVTLPCGRVVPNRLVKAPMYEHFAPLWGSSPHDGFIALYEKWGVGHWGMIITGNVQVAKDHLSLGRDLVVPDTLTDETLTPWRRLAKVIHHGIPISGDHHALAIMQLSHGGRQSLNVIGGRLPFARPLAPSPVRVGQMHAGKDGRLSRLAHWTALQVPREMTREDIRRAIQQFVHGARLAAESGFDGIEVHAAHGYLVSQFISPKSNHRTDEYSADRDPLRFLREIVFAIRATGVVPEDFVVGIKLNAADYARDTCTLQENRALSHVREIGKWGLVDFIEVSGGDYEDPQFIDTTATFKSPRQVVYESFAEQSVEILSNGSPTDTNRPPPLVVLTGGLNTLPRMSSALAHDHAHLLGIARLSVLRPSLPVELSIALANGSPDFLTSEPAQPTELGDPPRHCLSLRAFERLVCYMLVLLWTIVPAKMPRIVGASASVNWYNIMLRRIAFGQDVDYTMGMIGATVRFFFSSTPLPAEEGSGWWVAAALVGVALGVALGRVILYPALYLCY